jgi:hypothetical protein
VPTIAPSTYSPTTYTPTTYIPTTYQPMELPTATEKARRLLFRHRVQLLTSLHMNQRKHKHFPQRMLQLVGESLLISQHLFQLLENNIFDRSRSPIRIAVRTLKRNAVTTSRVTVHCTANVKLVSLVSCVDGQIILNLHHQISR